MIDVSKSDRRRQLWYEVKLINHWYSHIFYTRSDEKLTKQAKLYQSTTNSIIKVLDIYDRVIKIIRSFMQDFIIDIELISDNQKILISYDRLCEIFNKNRMYHNPVFTKTKTLNTTFHEDILKILGSDYLKQYERYKDRLEILESSFGSNIGRLVFLFDDRCLLIPSEDNVNSIIDCIPRIKNI